MLERKVGKPAWQPAERILLAGLSRLLPKSGLPSLLPKPETLLRIAIWSVASGQPSASALGANAQCATPSGGR